MTQGFKFVASEIIQKEVVERFFLESFEKVTQEILEEKKHPNPEYFPGIYYLKSHKIFCITNLFLMTNLCKFLSKNDPKMEMNLKKDLLAAGKYENDWRNFLLDILKYQHNVFHEQGTTKSYIRFAPAVYENRHGNVYEVQQIKLYSPTFEVFGFQSEMEHLERVMEGYAIRQMAYSHAPVEQFYVRNSTVKRAFR